MEYGSRRSGRHRAGEPDLTFDAVDDDEEVWAPPATTEPARLLLTAWKIAVAAVAVSMLLSVSGILGDPLSQAADDLAQLLAGGAAAACCWWSWRRATDPDRLWRLLLAIGTGGWACGQLIWTYYQVFVGTALPSPSLADVGYFALPVFALPALWVFPARPGIRPSGSAVRIGQIASRPFSRLVFALDSLVIVGSLFTLTWATALGAAIATRPSHHLLALLVAVGYPVTDLMLVVFVTLLGRFRRPRNPRALLLLGLGVVCISVSDSFFLYVVSTGANSMPPVLNIGFQIGPVLLALCALVPPAGAPRADFNRRRAERGLVLLPYLPLSITGLLIAGQLVTGSDIDRIETFVGLTLVVLVVLRQFVTLIDNVRLLHQLRQSQDQLSHQAFNDSLTGLANRALFRDRLDHAVALHRSDHQPLGLIFCDLDDFKLVNDGLGHAAGDELLRAVAVRLRECVKATDTVARLGGDEFAVLLEGVQDDAQVVAEQILAALSRPFTLHDPAAGGTGQSATVQVGASIGVALMAPGEPGISPDGLMARVDAAMYAAKRRGKNQLVTFRQDLMDTTASGLISDLRALLATKWQDPLMRAGGSIDLMYQPVVWLGNADVVALEALVRWQHPRLGLLSAEVLLAAAEDAGLLDPVEVRVLDTACRDISLVRRHPGMDQVAVHVNLSGQRIGDPRLIGIVQGALERHHLPGQALILEITETGKVPDMNAAADVLAEIRALDVRLALDDFGAGFSGLSYLLQLPIDIVKLDRSLTTATPGSRAATVRNAATSLILGLGLELIAEGVETEQQVAELADLGCAFGQGFLYAKPQFLTDLELAGRFVGG